MDKELAGDCVGDAMELFHCRVDPLLGGFAQGLKFTIREGGHTVGAGVVSEVLD
uniref:hypothetical protein n=1 Tax=Limosilactobacillus fermentum TaxID=1613 RepID=UPI00291609C9|nr:hypothetical protein [Limosilactobacillus fermentum]